MSSFLLRVVRRAPLSSGRIGRAKTGLTSDRNGAAARSIALSAALLGRVVPGAARSVADPSPRTCCKCVFPKVSSPRTVAPWSRGRARRRSGTPPPTLDLDGRRERVTLAPDEALELSARTVRIAPDERLLALSARPDPAARALAAEDMDRLITALDSGDSSRAMDLFVDRGEGAETIADLAGELAIDE